MDEESAGARVRKLRGEITQLIARADELTDAMGSEPAAPPPSTIERLQAYLADAITSGTANERKAAIEALIAEIRITEEGIIPVFRIPGPRTPNPGGDATATITAAEPVRALVRSVGGADGTRTAPSPESEGRSIH
jgi:site-specific DNA recombinase